MNYLVLFIMIVSICCTMYDLIKIFCMCLRQLFIKQYRTENIASVIFNMMMYGIFLLFFSFIFFLLLVGGSDFSLGENLVSAILVTYIYVGIYRTFTVCYRLKEQEFHNLKEFMKIFFIDFIYVLVGLNIKFHKKKTL